MIARLRKHNSLGQLAIAAQRRGISTAEFAAKEGYSEHTLRKIKAFAKELSADDLDQLCQLRPNGLPLHWGYIPVLLALQSKHGEAVRKQYQKRAIKEGWTVPELRSEIRSALGVHGRGRTPKIMSDLNLGLNELLADIEAIKRRCESLIEASKAKRDLRSTRQAKRLLKQLEAVKTDRKKRSDTPKPPEPIGN